jgi:hypothetical protein
VKNWKIVLKEEPRNVRIDQFSKTVPKCSKVKRFHFGISYIIETIESIYAGSEHLQILCNPGHSVCHWVCTHIRTATSLMRIKGCLNAQHPVYIWVNSSRPVHVSLLLRVFSNIVLYYWKIPLWNYVSVLYFWSSVRFTFYVNNKAGLSFNLSVKTFKVIGPVVSIIVSLTY